MADRTQHGAPISEHPDVIALQQQYGGSLGQARTVLGEGILALAGVWLAISPWVTGFDATSPSMLSHNLVLGIMIAAIGLGVTGAAERGHGLSWIAVPLGVWAIIATWVVPTAGPSAGLIWSNVVAGAVTLLAGGAVAGMTLMGGQKQS